MSITPSLPMPLALSTFMISKSGPACPVRSYSRPWDELVNLAGTCPLSNALRCQSI
ncbi:Uncharacterised protein [Mycobacteroides abscessus subsp. abscessus]|nr:Uncharacterised protein [Mycobacteroides abscessus subsp. abscessus]